MFRCNLTRRADQLCSYGHDTQKVSSTPIVIVEAQWTAFLGFKTQRRIRFNRVRVADSKRKTFCFFPSNRQFLNQLLLIRRRGRRHRRRRRRRRQDFLLLQDEEKDFWLFGENGLIFSVDRTETAKEKAPNTFQLLLLDRNLFRVKKCAISLNPLTGEKLKQLLRRVQR